MNTNFNNNFHAYIHNYIILPRLKFIPSPSSYNIMYALIEHSNMFTMNVKIQYHMLSVIYMCNFTKIDHTISPNSYILVFSYDHFNICYLDDRRFEIYHDPFNTMHIQINPALI